MNANNGKMGENTVGTMGEGSVGTMGSSTQDSMNDMRDNVEDMAGKAGESAEGMKDKMRNVAADLSNKASETASMVRDTAMERMDTARDALSDTGDRLAETLRRAAEQPAPDSIQARMLSTIATGVSTAADTLRERSVTEIADDIRAMARRNPGLFAAGAVVVGFALARFMRSSSRHTDHS